MQYFNQNCLCCSYPVNTNSVLLGSFRVVWKKRLAVPRSSLPVALTTMHGSRFLVGSFPPSLHVCVTVWAHWWPTWGPVKPDVLKGSELSCRVKIWILWFHFQNQCFFYWTGKFMSLNPFLGWFWGLGNSLPTWHECSLCTGGRQPVCLPCLCSRQACSRGLFAVVRSSSVSRVGCTLKGRPGRCQGPSAAPRASHLLPSCHPGVVQDSTQVCIYRC